MFPEDNEPYTDTDNEAQDQVELYSKNAIRGFSIFFSPIFGGILLSLNLWRAGFKEGIPRVILFCLGYMAITSVITSYVPTPGNFLTIVFYAIGGVILSDLFFARYFPDDDYYPRSIVRPLIVSIAFSLIVVAAIVYSGGGPAAFGIK